MSQHGAALGALRNHFNSGATRPLAYRKKVLKALRTTLIAYEEELLAAMHADMRKPRFEAYLSDIGLVLGAIDHALDQLDGWAAPKHIATPLSAQPAESTVYREPLGVVLIIAPWNYPLLLLLSPLVGAVAAGNCAVLKPSEAVPHTTAVIARIIRTTFDPAHVLVVEGDGATVVPALMEQFRFDHVFFTGSARVGRSLLAITAPQLVPVTLELGGKSPAIVDQRVDLKVAARRIVWSKFFNAGQTCIATDHALVHSSVREEFIHLVIQAIGTSFGEDPQQSPHFARLVNARQFERVKAYLAHGRVLHGGQNDPAEHYIAPTVLGEVAADAPVMHEEIFGPVLPVIGWTEPEEVASIVQRNPYPLATYIFSNDRKRQTWFRERIAFGGGCINHCMLQFAPQGMPFGGIGTSGMGRYHGRYSFDLFSHQKGIVQGSTLIDPGVQYPPYTALKEKVLRWVLR